MPTEGDILVVMMPGSTLTTNEHAAQNVSRAKVEKPCSCLRDTTTNEVRSLQWTWCQYELLWGQSEGDLDPGLGLHWESRGLNGGSFA